MNEDGQQMAVYEIRIRGHLGRRWVAWFEEMTITQLEDGETALSGPLADQAALYGLLRKVRDLGLPLLSVMRVEADSDGAAGRKS